MKSVPLKIPLFFLLASLLSSCTPKQVQNPLERALASEHPKIKSVMDSIAQHEVQIRYTQINRRGDSISFTDFDFQVDDGNYFYPASTVKFPAAVGTLEKLNQIDSLNRKTRFYIEGDSVETTFEESILQIFAISNNEANNRLIEFLGFDGLNNRMRSRGIEPIRLSHRLSTPDADALTTKPLVIYLNDSTTAVSVPTVSKDPVALDLGKIKKGNGFFDNDSLYQESFDFSYKNYFPVTAQSTLMKRIVFPEAFDQHQRFNLTESQRDFLLEAMQILPSEVGYDEAIYYNSYGKFFMFGDSEALIPNHIEIYNKVGYAYGTLTDCAYIKDTKNNIDFMLVATILVNEDGIFNDDQYEYDELGIPFLAQLGREIYDYELQRKR